MPTQKTIAQPISVSGVGIHTGQEVQMIIRPAREGEGIVFERTDCGVRIPVAVENVVETAFSTTLAWSGVRVRTVEHLLAAMSGLGVCNATIELDSEEVPFFDGSARPFVELLGQAGVVEQSITIPELLVTRAVRVVEGDRWVEIEPGGRLEVIYHIHFAAPVIGSQSLQMGINRDAVALRLAPARSFIALADVHALREQGLIKGGRLDCGIVVDGDRVINGPLRYRDEFVRHKILDLLGDFALLEYPLRAKVRAHRAGHRLHVAAVRELLANPECWELVEPGRRDPLTVSPYRAEYTSAMAAVG